MYTFHVKSIYVKLRKAENELKLSKCLLGMKTPVKSFESQQRYRAMSKDIGELII